MKMKLAKLRGYQYQPRYYDPKKDEEAQKKRRIKFTSTIRKGRNRPFLVNVILFILILLILIYFSGRN